ncbi:transposase, IS4 family [Alteromonadaceae bacterium 2753L.S.0a.02]|nr:transposase, IS4 family [Alteromonadaceae bacterium 2753L.S.0a.02]
MPNFKPDNYNQDFLIALNFLEQIEADPFAMAIHLLVDRMDMSRYFQSYKNDNGGRPAYSPALLLKIILYSYTKGIRTSRDIEWHCKHNIIIRSLACDRAPHYTTIAHFISSHPEGVKDVFEHILLCCEEEGLLGHELIAIDGCKISSNAAKEHSGTLKELEAKREKIAAYIDRCITEHQSLDGRRVGEKERKNELEKRMDRLLKHHDKIDHFLKNNGPRKGKGQRNQEVKSNITDNESGKLYGPKGTQQGYNGVAAVDQQNQVIVDAESFGEGNENHTLQPVLETLRERYHRLGISENLYEDGTVITADTGFYSEANNAYLKRNKIDAYTPDPEFRQRDERFDGQHAKYGSKNRVKVKKHPTRYPASAFKFDAKQKTCVCPAGKELLLYRELHMEVGKYRFGFEGRLTDCRHCALKNNCLRNPASPNTRKGKGRQVTFIHRTAACPTEWMKARVDSKEGKRRYGQRMATVEPVFGNITVRKGLDYFTLRGKTKVDIQWKLYCTVHNVEKLVRYGNIV